MRTAAVALAAVFYCGLAHGQAVPGNASLSYEALAKAAKGSWAEYKMVVGDKAPTTVRYSLVDKSPKTMSLEIETNAPPLMMHMDFTANGSTAWTLRRIRMKMGDSSEVQEVPPPENGSEQIIKKGGAFGTPAGTETIKTPAGSFHCQRYKQTTAQGQVEVWMSDQALPSGLVQTVVPSLKAKITLVATGSGAVAKIQ